MAPAIKPLSLSQRVSSTLQTLTNRPGVESTLILSRQDGSIIKVTGSLDDESEHPENAITSLDTRSPTHEIAERLAATSSEDVDVGDGIMPTDVEVGPTRAEKLASDIFLFVSAASFLASSLQSTTSSKASYKNGISYRQSKDEMATANGRLEADSGEVQLLRMRSKKHEIVIFPDPNFLCCVIQNVERQSR